MSNYEGMKSTYTSVRRETGNSFPEELKPELVRHKRAYRIELKKLSDHYRLTVIRNN